MVDIKMPVEVRIEWLDATTETDQLTFREARERCNLYHRFTLGFIVKRNREVITVAQTFDPACVMNEQEDSGADFTTIPRGWIKSITTMVPAAQQTPEKEDE